MLFTSLRLYVICYNQLIDMIILNTLLSTVMVGSDLHILSGSTLKLQVITDFISMKEGLIFRADTYDMLVIRASVLHREMVLNVYIFLVV